MQKQEREIGIDRANPLLQAFARNSWIAEVRSVKTSHNGNRQEMSGRIWTPDMADRQKGVWRPVEITLAQFYDGSRYLYFQTPLYTGECRPDFMDFPEELNVGLQEFFKKQVTLKNPDLTYEIIPGISHEDDSGLAVIFDPDMNGVENQAATWSFTFDFDGDFNPRQFGYQKMEDFTGAVIYRLAASVSPAVRYLQQKFPGEYKKLVSKREQRTRTKPPSWILGFFRKHLNGAGGEWRQPASGTEPDTFWAYGYLLSGESEYFIVADSTESGKRQNLLSLAIYSEAGVRDFEKYDEKTRKDLREMLNQLSRELSQIRHQDQPLFNLFSFIRNNETRSVGIDFQVLPKINETDCALFGLTLTAYGIDLKGLETKGITREQIVRAFLDRAKIIQQQAKLYLEPDGSTPKKGGKK